MLFQLFLQKSALLLLEGGVFVLFFTNKEGPKSLYPTSLFFLGADKASLHVLPQGIRQSMGEGELEVLNLKLYIYKQMLLTI